MTTEESDATIQEKPERKSRRLLWIALAALLLVVIVAVAGSFAIRASETSYLEAALAAVESGDWAAAEASLDQTLGVSPEFLRQHVTRATALRGLALYQQGHYATALADLDAALAADPGQVDLYVYRADSHFQGGEAEAALQDLETALEHVAVLPEHLVAMLHADRVAILRQQADAAAISPGAVLAAADAALESGDYLSDEAVASILAGRAQSAYELGETEQAFSDSSAALAFEAALPPEIQAEMLANQASIYYEADLLELALATSEPALALGTLEDESKAALQGIRADAFFRGGNLEAAIAEAESAARMGQDEARLHSLLAVQHLDRGDEEQALAEAELALESDADNALAHRVKGTLYAWQGRIDEALAELDRAHELDPADVETLAMRVYAYLELNDLAAAEAELESVRQVNPAAAAVLWAGAQIAHYNYDYDEARALLDLAIEREDDRPEYYADRANTYRLTTERELAAADVERALALNDDFPLALAGQMDLFAQSSEWDEFGEVATRLVELYPSWYTGHSSLAFYHRAILDEAEIALEHIEKVLELRPESTVGYLERGYYHMGNESYDLSRADFEEAMALRPNSLDAKEGLADLHWAMEEYDEAIALYDEILAVLPDSQRAMLGQGRIRYSQGELEEAWKKVHESLSVDPDHAHALTMRAELLIDTGQLAEAHLDLLRALEETPSYAWAHYVQGYAYLLQGRVDEARQAVETALQLDPSLTNGYLLLNLLALSEEDLEEAQRQAELWVEAEPEWAPAHYHLGLSHNYQGNGEEAVEAMSAAIELAEEDSSLLGESYYGRSLAYLDLADETLAEADLRAAIASTSDLDVIDQAEVLLADPGVRAVSRGGRRIIEDEENGYTISYDESWRQTPADPAQNYVLSLAYGEETIDASVDVFTYYDWDPRFSVFELAEFVSPESFGATAGTPESIEIGDASGLKVPYEMEVSGGLLKGYQYILIRGDRAAIIYVEAMEGIFEEFEPEFEAIAASFAFIP